MTDWTGLAEPFPDSEVKQRPGAATYEHKPSCDGARCRDTRDASKHIQFSYIDARAVAERLDNTVGPGAWEFTCSVIPGSDIVKGRLAILDGERWVVREDHGYPNSDRDEEPIKAATSDALKRCGVLFGIGRHLYDDNKAPARPQATQRPAPVAPARTSTAVPDDPYGDELDFDGAVAAVPKAAPSGWVCRVHGTSKLVPAGVSKRTGNAYDAFLACTEQDCKEKPPRNRAA